MVPCFVARTGGSADDPTPAELLPALPRPAGLRRASHGAAGHHPGVLVLLIETVLDDVLIAKDHRALALMPFAVVGLYLLGGILRVGRGMLTVTSLGESSPTSEVTSCTHVSHAARWHQRHAAGASLARLTQDVNTIQYGVSGIVPLQRRSRSLSSWVQRPG